MSIVSQLVALALFLNSVLAGASEAEHEAPADGMRTYGATASARDVVLPSALISRIERDYREFITEKNKVLKVEKTGLNRGFLDVAVELTQERVASLPENIRILLPTGGGVIDLEPYVSTEPGAFFVKFAPQLNKEPVTDMQVYYVSHARQRKLEGETYGAGCGKFMGLSHIFNYFMGREGFRVYSTDQRYVTVLSGIYVITKFDPDALYVATVVVKDSRFPEMGCH